MGLEIERKFLVEKDAWEKLNIIPDKKVNIRQGFLSVDKKRVVRIRMENDVGLITIKGITTGITRQEFEYEIPGNDAETMLDSLCLKPIIEKIRYFISYDNLEWTIDEFYGLNEGLIIAEVELDEPGVEIKIPEWILKEVSDDPKYYNSNLVRNPFRSWNK